MKAIFSKLFGDMKESGLGRDLETHPSLVCSLCVL